MKLCCLWTGTFFPTCGKDGEQRGLAIWAGAKLQAPISLVHFPDRWSAHLQVQRVFPSSQDHLYMVVYTVSSLGRCADAKDSLPNTNCNDLEESQGWRMYSSRVNILSECQCVLVYPRVQRVLWEISPVCSLSYILFVLQGVGPAQMSVHTWTDKDNVVRFPGKLFPAVGRLKLKPLVVNG